jgi:hypothetical protein
MELKKMAGDAKTNLKNSPRRYNANTMTASGRDSSGNHRSFEVEIPDSTTAADDDAYVRLQDKMSNPVRVKKSKKK